MKLSAGTSKYGKDIALRCPRPYSGRNLRNETFGPEVAPLDAARMAQRTVPTTTTP